MTNIMPQAYQIGNHTVIDYGNTLTIKDGEYTTSVRQSTEYSNLYCDTGPTETIAIRTEMLLELLPYLVSVWRKTHEEAT